MASTQNNLRFYSVAVITSDSDRQNIPATPVRFRVGPSLLVAGPLLPFGCLGPRPLLFPLLRDLHTGSGPYYVVCLEIDRQRRLETSLPLKEMASGRIPKLLGLSAPSSSTRRRRLPDYYPRPVFSFLRMNSRLSETEPPHKRKVSGQQHCQRRRDCLTQLAAQDSGSSLALAPHHSKPRGCHWPRLGLQ